MGKVLIPPAGGAIEPVNLREALERYLAYALSDHAPGAAISGTA
jgi:hypothetical protein